MFGVAFSPNGKLLAAASGDGTVAVWDINSPDQPLFDKPVGNGKPMYAVAFSPDGKTLAATGAEGSGYLWDVEAGRRFNLRTSCPHKVARLGRFRLAQMAKWWLQLRVSTARLSSQTLKAGIGA